MLEKNQAERELVDDATDEREAVFKEACTESSRVLGGAYELYVQKSREKIR